MATQPKVQAATAEDLDEQMVRLRKDVETLTQTVSELAKSEVDGAKFAVKRRMVEFGDRGRDVLDNAEEKVRDVEAQAIEYVRTKPLQSMAIAAGVGVLVGFLTRGR